MKLEDLKNKRILILGYGKEGKATEQYLKANLPDAVVGIADKIFDPDYLSTQKDYDIAIKTPGIPKSFVTIPYTTGTNIFFANVKAKTIGVTGSKGKSTTSSLIHHILLSVGKKTHLIGNIGNPMLSELLKPYEPDDIFVCELSSYQIEDIQYSPYISVVTSLFPEHMNYHGNIQAYYEAKHMLIAHTKSDDYFVYNPNNEILQSWAKNANCKTIPFDKDFIIQEIQLLGEHNRQNARGAATVARLFGIKDEQIQSAISTFLPLPHRLQNIGTYKEITFYDDAISTAPESTISAIESLSKIGTLILGGEDRGYDFNLLVQIITLKKISTLILFPQSGDVIEKLVHQQTTYKPLMYHANNMQSAVKFSYQHTPKGTICLLSTASPSYSLWKNFEEKGDEFQKWVKKLGS